MKIFIATDHRGVDTVKKIVSYLKNLEIDITESKIEHNDLLFYM